MRKPAPGRRLTSDDELIIVIERGWTDEQIREAAARYDSDGTGPYELEEFRYHTAAQRAADGVGTDYDWYWSPEGWGASTIDVAVFS